MGRQNESPASGVGSHLSNDTPVINKTAQIIFLEEPRDICIRIMSAWVNWVWNHDDRMRIVPSVFTIPRFSFVGLTTWCIIIILETSHDKFVHSCLYFSSWILKLMKFNRIGTKKGLKHFMNLHIYIINKINHKFSILNNNWRNRNKN